jgi:putative membrane protein
MRGSAGEGVFTARLRFDEWPELNDSWRLAAAIARLASGDLGQPTRTPALGPGPILTGQAKGAIMYGPYDHGWMFGAGSGMVFGGLWMILIWAIPLLALFALVKYLFFKPRDSGRDVPPDRRTPLDILKEAYARGEIERDEYLRKRDDLLHD